MIKKNQVVELLRRQSDPGLPLEYRAALPISMDDLRNDWQTWLDDYQHGGSSLRFGQYVLNKRLLKGWCWPDCYYADTEKAWDYLFSWINTKHTLSHPKPFLT